MKTLTVTIDANGRASMVYDDALVPVLKALGGEVTVERASHVEPAPGGGWTADMGPSGGPVLGPFPLREQALAAEREWLSENKGL